MKWISIRNWIKKKNFFKNPRKVNSLVGQRGEKEAAFFLHNLGYKILLKNVKIEGYELDLVCRDKEVLVFVEVKTRSSIQYGFPYEAVDAQKKRNLIAAAHAYLKLLKNPVVAYRFDVVEVLFFKGTRPKITHYPNAFGMGSGF
ncbi:YraN family protein [Candidatus Methylacidiphilum infernorum]|uniref:YraN family protein n=1 Tax=Candidatus Methylacidiphilum infernorum TaxID=511746 RepID=UPI0002EB82BF|nr:YraN family protein [Candidatus Methylacidiphilum infernorum]